LAQNTDDQYCGAKFQGGQKKGKGSRPVSE